MNDKTASALVSLFFLGSLMIGGCFPTTDSSQPSETQSATAVTNTMTPDMSGQDTSGQDTSRQDNSEPDTISCRDETSGVSLTYDDALAIVQSGPCFEEGGLKDNQFCNHNTGTWWFDLDIDQPGCNPACVVDLNKRTAEINWRCSGAVPPSETETSVAKPSASPTEAISNEMVLKDVAYQDVHFSYPESFATDVSLMELPSEPFLILDGNIIPQHLEFSFNNYLLPAAFHKPRLYVFPVQEFVEGNEIAAREIPRLQQLLANKPADPERAIPFLPLVNAGEMMRAQLAYLDFLSGQGVRYLAQMGQSYQPINNRGLFYSFQGLTADGRFYVSLVLPVTHPMLPANEIEIPGGDAQAFVDNYETYAREIEQQLDSQKATSFEPDLTWIDLLVGSIEITNDLSQQTSADYSDWQTYTNEVFGYSVQVPGDIMILEAPDNSFVNFDGPLVDNERWPMLSISHYASDFYRPGKGIEVREWILDSEIVYDEIGLESELAGWPVIHLSVESSPQANGSDEYYLIKDRQLFRIALLHAAGKEDWTLYNQFLESFTFLDKN